MWAFKVVLEEDEKVLQTGQTLDAIASDMLVQFEEISSVELRSDFPPNFTINRHFLPDGWLVLTALPEVASLSFRTELSTKASVSTAELGCPLVDTGSICDPETALVVING